MRQTISNLLQPLSRLSYPQKFVLISLIFIIPLAAFVPLIVQQMDRINQYGDKEYSGALYLRPLQHILQLVQEHDRLAARQLAGESISDRLTQTERDIDEAFTELINNNQQSGENLKAGSRAADLNKQWQALRDGVRTRAFSLAQSQQQHDDLVASTRTFISYIGDASYLILDPDLDTYYMMDAVLLKMPEAQTFLSEATEISRAALARGSPNANELYALTTKVTLLRDRINAIDSGVKYALQQNETGAITARNAEGKMRELVEQPLKDALAANRALLDAIDQGLILAGDSMALTPRELETLEQRANTANAAFYERASQALEIGVLARRARYGSLLVLALVIAGLGIILGFLVGLWVMRAISRPLSQLVATAHRLSTGDLTARAPVSSEDEVGKVALAFNSFVDALGVIVGRVVDGSTKLASGATQISAASNEMSAGAESQTQQAIRTSSAMEEIAATIKEVANNAAATAKATDAAALRAREGSTKVQEVLAQLNETNASLQQLRNRSTEIDQLVKLIADIAAQTNILALNAAIEAAGAGAAGARFDVVAEEIRKLAQRTAESTTRISGTVTDVREEIQAAAKRTNELAAQAEQVGQSLTDIVEGVTSVNDMITSISTATNQQSRAVEQVAMSLQLITQVSQQTAQAAHETASTIDDLSSLAHDLNQATTRFKV